jgi:cysteine-rich repeat protein
MRSLAAWSYFITATLLFTVACGDDDDSKNQRTEDSGIGDDVDASEGQAASAGKGGKAANSAGKGGAGGIGGRDSEAGEDDADGGVASCGNDRTEKELGEECDDGNYNDNDGCTSLCEYTCADDASCSDGDPCNGEETCTEEHKCQSGDQLPDKTNCGSARSCFKGICLNDACGDTWVQTSEECDDGNSITDVIHDSCTTNCKWSCLSTDSTRNCSDIGHSQCAPAYVCNDSKHLCEVAASAAPDKTACDLNGVASGGWCMGGQCVETNCGDGEPGGNEECDKGSQNGVPESGCTVGCKTQVCGNNKLEAGEQCDDGNRKNLDSCDKDCKYEFWYRYTSMNITKEAAPEWCVYSTKNTGNQTSNGNQFGNAFPGMVSVPGSDVGLEVIKIINDMLNGVLADCSANVLNKVVDSSDTSFRSIDDDIKIAVYDGALEVGQNSAYCNTKIDTRFSVKKNAQNAEDPVVSMIKTAQRPELIRSETPVDIQATIPGIGVIKLYNLLARINVDMTTLSTPAAPPTVSSDVKIPQKIGYNNPNTNPYTPSGRLCAAVGVDSMSQVGFPAEPPLSICCKADGTKFTACQAGQTPGVGCDSFLTVIQKGCTACLDSVSTGKAMCGNECTSSSVEVVRATDPDVDLNGDGTNDAYSAVIAVEGVRVRTTGVK